MIKQAQSEGTIEYTNSTGSDISAGGVIDLGSRVGIAAVDIDSLAVGTVLVKGVYTLKKDTSVVSQSDELFWDVTASAVSTTQGVGDPRLGIACKDAATGDGYANADINAPKTVGDTSVTSGAGDAAANAAAIITIIGILQNAGLAEKP